MRISEQLAPVRLEILRSDLVAVASDVAATLEHGSSIEAITELREYAVAFTDADGKVLSADNPAHLPSLAMTGATILDRYQFNLKSGDLIITNDPYSGGTRVQDLTLFAPVHARGELLGAVLVRTCVPDFGGQITGGFNPQASELWAEGVRIPPIKLARYGRVDQDVRETLLLNSRLREPFERELHLMIAAVEHAKKRVSELLGRYGLDLLREGMAHALRYAERAVRLAITHWQEGTFSGEAMVGHDCSVRSPMVRCQVKVSKDQVLIDLSASDNQSAWCVNSSWASSCGSALLPILALLPPDIPLNSGLLRVVRFDGRDSTIVRPAYPAAVGFGPLHPGREIVNAVSIALTRCVSDALPLVPVEVTVNCCFRDYRVWSLDSLVHSGAGATADQMAWGPPSYFARRRLASIETSELAFPEILIEQLEMSQREAGARRNEGAPGYEITALLKAPAAITACLAAPAPEYEEGWPVLTIRSDENGTEVIARYCANRHLRAGILKLRTASGPHADLRFDSRGRAEAAGP